MYRLYALQQRLVITSFEVSALLFFSVLLLGGAGYRHLENQDLPPVDYTALDAAVASRTEGLHESNPEPATESVPSEANAAVAEAPRSAPRSTRRAAGPIRMNLNTASERTLQRLPGVGPAIAGRIAAYREAYGGFRSPREIVRVKGIGPKTFEKIAPFIFTDEAEPPAEQLASADTE